MKFLVLCIVAVVWIQLPSEGSATCCGRHTLSVRDKEGHWHHTKACGDCSSGTPYCSQGSCNLFGCACEGACRSGPCDGTKVVEQVRRGAETAHDVIRAADKDMDGMMSLGEAHAHLAIEGFPAERLARSLAALDVDKDNFLSAHEIDFNTN